MKILLTGAIKNFSDKKGTAVLESIRKGKDAAVPETFYLKFYSDDAYNAFKGKYPIGQGVQVIGLIRQFQAPMQDRVTKKNLVGSNGKEIRNSLLAIEVKEHKSCQREEFDTLYAHGLVTVIDKRELAKSGGGLSFLKARVAYNHYKRQDEEQGQSDFYNIVAFGAQADSLDNLEKGQRFIIDYAVPAMGTYEMKDLTHSDGSPVMRNGLELTIREFSFLPRSNRQQETNSAGRIPADLPF